MQAFQTLFQLQWNQVPKYQPLPSHVERTYVPTARGNLELLVCRPKKTASLRQAPPVFFVHGGFGHAGVWLEWMTYLYEHDYPSCVYAYSARNHGASYAVSYLQMVLNTPLSEIASDLATCVHHAEYLEAQQSRMTLVAHSAGGGLSQYALSHGMVEAQALCLVDAVPHFGMADLYWNWFKHDPGFPLRSLLHLGHPSSPLSTLPLVQSAFFGTKISRAQVAEFMKWMPCYESMGWPVGQFGSFWQWFRGKNVWLEVASILEHIELSRNGEQKDAVCIIVGTEDMMYRKAMYERAAKEYGHSLLILQIKQGMKQSQVVGGEDNSHADGDGVSVSRADGVRVILARGSGHHVQNDTQSSMVASALMSWVLQS